MPYFKKNSLVMSKRRRSGLSGWTDTVGDLAKGAVSLFGSQQKAAGAAEALAAQNQAMINAQNSGGGISTETLVIGGAALAAVAFIVLRKKS